MLPHEKYLKTMILSGMPWETIEIHNSMDGFNVIPDSIYKTYLEECDNLPGGKEMIKKNIKNLKDKSKPYISEKILDEFAYPDYFCDLVYQCMGYPRATNKSSGFHSITKTLTNRRERTFLEIAAILGMPFKEIKAGWGKLIGKKISEHANAKLACFYYYYWGFTLYNMRTHGVNKGIDIVSYLESTRLNDYYYPHKQLIFTSAPVLFSYFGLLSNDDRLIMEKEEYGRCHQIIMDSLDKRSYNIAPWIITEHARTSEGIDRHEGAEGKDFYRRELDRIFRTAVTRTDEHSLMDIDKNKRRLEAKPEKDEPYDIKRKS